MTDREKVIKGLEKLREFADSEVHPILSPDNWGIYSELRDLIDEAEKDALAILKAQEPRLLTLDEVIAHYSLPPVFVDDLGMQEDYYEDIQPLYFEFPHDSEDSWIVHWRGHSQVARYLDEWKDSYNKKWRCWTSRPDEKVRAETLWAT